MSSLITGQLGLGLNLLSYLLTQKDTRQNWDTCPLPLLLIEQTRLLTQSQLVSVHLKEEKGHCVFPLF